MQRITAILFLILSSAFGYGEEYMKYTPIDGLSSLEVTAVTEDSDFLWIATRDGLNRFDGKTFKVFKKDNNSPNSLSSNNIETICLDHEGLLWIGFKSGGVDVYNPRKDLFFHINEHIDGIPDRIISIFGDSQNNIWLGSWEEGIFRLTPSGKDNGEKYSVTRTLPGYIVSSITEKPRGMLWVGTYSGIFLYDMYSQRWITPDFDTGIQDYSVTQLYDDGSSESLWCSTWARGLLKLKWDQSGLPGITVEKCNGLPEGTSVYRLAKEKEHRFLVGTWGKGLKALNEPLSGAAVIDGFPREKINDSIILCIYNDRYGNIWIGTDGDGLYKLDVTDRGIYPYKTSTGSLPSSVYRIAPFGNNRILIGTHGNGWYLYDVKQNRQLFRYVNSDDSALGNYTLSFYLDRRLLLVGYDDAGILAAPVTDDMHSEIHLKKILLDEGLAKVTFIFKDMNGRLWLGTKQNGLKFASVNPLSGEISGMENCLSIARQEITGMADYDSCHVWVAAHNGLFLLNTRSMEVEQQKRYQVDDMVYALTPDKQNKCIWLGTSTGISKVKCMDSISIEHDVFAGQIPEGKVDAITLDSGNNLWFTINGRLFCLINDPHRLKEISIDRNRQAFLTSCVLKKDNKEYIALGGSGDLTLIDPEIVLKQPDDTHIVFTELQIDHKKVNVGEQIYGQVIMNENTVYTQHITIPYKCKWISMSFAEVGFGFYKKRYRYMIAGYTDQWQMLDLTSPITFSRLPHGDYSLLIADQEEHDPQRNCWKLNITVIPPWWQKPLAYFFFLLLILLSFILITILIARYYRRRQKTRLLQIEKAKKEELLREKESFFTNLSHDLLTPLSLIVAPVKDLLKQNGLSADNREKLGIIHKNAGFLSEVFGMILDFKKAETKNTGLEEKSVEIVSFTHTLISAFEYLALSKQIRLQFSSSVSSLYLLIDTVKIERVIFNLINNALKFTPEGGEVKVLLQHEQEGWFSIIITDNGEGIKGEYLSHVFDKFYQEPRTKDHETKGFGLGLYIVRKFVMQMGGKITIHSSPGAGTKVKIVLPEKEVTPNTRYETEDADIERSRKTDDLTTVLIAEDNEEMRNYLKGKLLDWFRVITAKDGEEAFEMVQTHLPEIVVSDVLMPRLDGLELCRKIKENALYSDIFVILFSAKSSPEDEMQGYRIGADFYMKKPFDPDIFLTQIRNIHATRQRRKSQLLAEFVSPVKTDFQFNPKEEFLKQSLKVIQNHLMDSDFSIDDFASEMNVSKTVLHRKFRTLTGQTPNQFIRTVRLRKAVSLLTESNMTIAEISYLTGFNQSHYFIKCFRECYNETPNNFRKMHQKK